MALYPMTCVLCGHVLYDLYYFWYLCSMASVIYGFIPYDLCPLWPCTLWPVSFLVHVLHVKCLLYLYTLWPAFSVAMYSMTGITFGTCAPWASVIYGFIQYDLCPLWPCTLWPVSFLVHVLNDKCPQWLYTLWHVSSVAIYSMTCIILVHVLHDKYPLWLYAPWHLSPMVMFTMTCIILGTCAHRVATASFWRTFHHEDKISPGWWGWGVRAHPFSLHLPSPVKLQWKL